MIALVLAVACMAQDSIAQTVKESVDVPPHSNFCYGSLKVEINFTAASMAVGIQGLGRQTPQPARISH
jgi:hypothetical protein